MLGRLTSETNPESGTTTYTYDSYTPGACGGWTSEPGQLMLTTFASGTQICYVYDSLGRLTDGAGWNSSTGTCRRYRFDNSSNGLFTAPGTVTNASGRMIEAETDNCSKFPPTTLSRITDEWFSYDADGHPTDMWQFTPNSGGYYHSTASYWPHGMLKTLARLNSSGRS